MEYTEQRITSRLPKGLHSWLKGRAKKTNRSMNGELVNILEAAKINEEITARQKKIDAMEKGERKNVAQEMLDQVKEMQETA